MELDRDRPLCYRHSPERGRAQMRSSIGSVCSPWVVDLSGTEGRRPWTQSVEQEQLSDDQIGRATRTYGRLIGLSDGHGWFRTSDLSRVKRYVTGREVTCSAWKQPKYQTAVRATESSGVCVSFMGVRAARAPQVPIRRERWLASRTSATSDPGTEYPPEACP